MDYFEVLEAKVTELVSRLKDLYAKNCVLNEEKAQLNAKIESMENSMLSNVKRIEELDQEKALAKMVVDDVIKSIDSLTESER